MRVNIQHHFFYKKIKVNSFITCEPFTLFRILIKSIFNQELRNGKINFKYYVTHINVDINLIMYHNKHLMPGPARNSRFCFPELLNVPRGEAEGVTLKSRGNKTLCFRRD